MERDDAETLPFLMQIHFGIGTLIPSCNKTQGKEVLPISDGKLRIY